MCPMTGAASRPRRAASAPSRRDVAASARRALRVHEILLAEYGEPVWRNSLPAIDELVSTILSQNTNDTNRDRAFEALRVKFPAWEAVRDAPADAVIEAIRPAGLANQKGPRLQQVLRAITAERGALDLEFLKDWPGSRRFYPHGSILLSDSGRHADREFNRAFSRVHKKAAAR